MILSEASHADDTPPSGTETKQTSLIPQVQLVLLNSHSCSCLPSLPSFHSFPFFLPLPFKLWALATHSLFRHYTSLPPIRHLHFLSLLTPLRRGCRLKPPHSRFVSVLKRERRAELSRTVSACKTSRSYKTVRNSRCQLPVALGKRMHSSHFEGQPHMMQ